MVLKDGDTFEVKNQKDVELVLARLEARLKGEEEKVTGNKIFSKEEKKRGEIATTKGNKKAMEDIMFRNEFENRAHINFVKKAT